MNRAKFGFCASAVCLTVAFWAGAASAGDEIPETAIYADMSVQSQVTYTLKDDSTATLTNGSDLVVSAQFNGNTTPSFSWNLHSLTFDAKRAARFWIDGGSVSVGEGGITFLQNDVWVAGRSSETDRRITITADQEWKGTETDPGETIRAAIYVGSTYSTYYKMGLGVSDGVTQLTLSRYLDAWFSGQNTKMGNLDLTVKAPARLRLVNRKSSLDIDGRLGCRSLTLVGDGDALALGGRPAACDDTQMYLTPYLDASHFAPVLNLADGADLAMSTAYATVGTFAIPAVNATKPADAASDGVSAITGPFVVTQELTTVTLAGDPTLDFTGATLTESGVAAGWNISGPGTVRFAAAKYKLTGPLVLGAGATVNFAGAMDFSSFALTGDADATLELDPGTDGESVLNDLGNFAGTVRIKSGKVILIRGEGASKVIEDGGTKVASGGLIVTDVARTEEEIVVRTGETLQIFGNGLTAETTVVLDGGTMLFRNPVSASSPVKVRQKSWIATETLAVTGTVAGAVDCAITNSTTGLWIAGDGCVRFAGGAVFAGNTTDKDERHALRVGQGSVLLTGGDYRFGYAALSICDPDASDNKWGQSVCVCDGGNVTFADPGDGAGSSRTVIYVSPRADGAYYSSSSAFEIGIGGKVTLPWNSNIMLGNNQNVGRLVLNGGELRLNGRYHPLYLTSSAGGYITGVLEMRAGVLELEEALRRGNADGQGRIIWSGGTIKLTKYYSESKRSLYAKPLGDKYKEGDPLRTWVQIAGDGCVLDMTDYPYDLFDGVPCAGCDRSEWFGTGTLTVKGGKTFRMFSVPNGVNLVAAGDGTTIEIPPEAKVFDNDKCVANMNAKPYPLNIYSSKDEEIHGTLALESFKVIDGAGVLSNGLANTETTIAAVKVGEGGVWNNLSSVIGENASVSNMVFEEGGVLEARVNGLLTPTLAIAGALTLPESAVFRSVKDPGVDAEDEVLIRAEEGIVGAAKWSSTRGPYPAVRGNDLILERKGLMLLFR